MLKNNLRYLFMSITVLIAVVICFVLQQRHSDRVLAIACAKAAFSLSQLSKGDQPYDSVYAEKQMVTFYKQGVLVGSSIITME